MDPTKRVFAALTASALLLFLSLTVVGSNAPGTPPLAAAGSAIAPAAPTNNFDQFVIVLMENHDLSDIYGPAPYMTQLADQYAFAQHWASITNPSQPNYIALIGGSTFGVSGDGNHPNLNYPTLVDIIENSGHTWNAIAEGSGSGCSINPDRGEDHFPFLSYTTITGSPARCANLHSGGPTDVAAALNAGTNFIWFTPNDGHNMHDNSVSSGDSWLQSWVPGLLSAMAGKHAALFLTYDEGYASPPLVYSGFSGPAAKLAYKSTTSYTHYSLLKLIEDVWGGGSLGQGDVNAASPLEFFGAGGPPVPDFSIGANPGSVSFIPSQSATSTITLTSTGGFTGTVVLTVTSAPGGVTGSCSPSSVSGSQSSACTLTGTTAGSYTITVTGTSGSLVHTTSISATVSSNPPPPGGGPPGGRDPLLWPFSRDSIWNLPIGASAVYVPASIQQPTQRGMTTDPDVIILTPNATMTAVYYNSDGWSGGSRCSPQGNVLFNAPIPDRFVVPGAGSTNPDGTTPNYATAILMPDGHTLTQGQPFARCTAGGPATMWWSVTNDLYGTGIDGGHGGSGLSSLGGTIRLGELVPGGVIRHVMKINLYGLNNYYYGTTQGYRWPASQADGCASSCYGGTTQALRMGSLLAIPASVNVDSLGLETEPAKILARALQDYGAYTVDDTAWSVYAIATEFGPAGRVDTEFSTAWGFAINPSTKTVPWARDMDRLFGALNVVDNWDAAQWATVSASSGAQGAGGGAPIVPWAPDFGTGTPGPSEPTAPGPSLPSLPAEWLPAVVGPGVALGLLLIAFVLSRRSERSRRRKASRRNGSARTSRVTQASARPRATSRPRRYIPPNEFEDESSEF